MSINWELLPADWVEPEGPSRRECHTPKCQVCGKFTKRLHLVYRGFPPEPDQVAGDCCLQPGDRTWA